MARKKTTVRIVMGVALALMLSGCATYATRHGVVTPIGFFTPTMQVNAGRRAIASYTVLFGLFTIGYVSFINQTEGRDIDVVDTNFLFIFRRIRALERTGAPTVIAGDNTYDMVIYEPIETGFEPVALAGYIE